VKVRQTIKRLRRKQSVFLEELKAGLPYFFKLKSDRWERMESKRYAKSLDDNTIKTLRKHYRGKTKASKLGVKSYGKTGSTPEYSCTLEPQEKKILKSEEVTIITKGEITDWLSAGGIY
jgi:hypothetical protein